MFILKHTLLQSHGCRYRHRAEDGTLDDQIGVPKDSNKILHNESCEKPLHVSTRALRQLSLMLFIW